MILSMSDVSYDTTADVELTRLISTRENCRSKKSLAIESTAGISASLVAGRYFRKFLDGELCSQTIIVDSEATICVVAVRRFG